MQGDAAPSWADSDQFQNLAGMDTSDFDFTSLPDALGEFDLGLTFDHGFETSGNAQAMADLGSRPEDTPMEGITTDATKIQPTQQDQNRNLHSEPDFMNFSIDSHYGSGVSQPPNEFSVSAPQELNYFPGGMVPPTPTSMELTGNDAARYLDSIDPATRAAIEQQFMRKNDMAQYTPHMTPVDMPNEARHYAPADYNNAGPTFSPLASPALIGQGEYSRVFGNASHAGGSLTSSPSDDREDVDMMNHSTPGQAPPSTSRPKKATRGSKATAPGSRSTGPTPRVRQSPIVKPQRRKGNSTTIPPREVQALLGQSALAAGTHSPTSAPLFRKSRSRGGSDGESISPEPLSEVMGPPPKPPSALSSPNLVAHPGGYFTAHQSHLSPATPASLLRRTHQEAATNSRFASPAQSPAQAALQMAESLTLDDLVLPEAAAGTSRSQAGSGSTIAPGPVKGTSSLTNTPLLSAHRPDLGTIRVPPNGGASALSSPLPMASPLSTPLATPKPSSTTPNLAAANGKTNSKKRGSVSGGHLVSPALRPKMSPSIKPLLPEGGAMSAEAHAMLLASKSNYHHIIEGTALPGSYPDTLSRGLTSKRTSHKLAEQGRRNRINTALVEMQALLPASFASPSIKSRRGSVSATASPEVLAKDAAAKSGGKTADGDAGDSGDKNGKAAAQMAGHSKAATVESAIAYIRQLQTEAEERRRAMEEKDREIEELRLKVGQLGKE